MKQHVFKLRSEPHGVRVRVTVFAGYADQVPTIRGTLTMKNMDEWRVLRALLQLGANFTPAKVIIEGEL